MIWLIKNDSMKGRLGKLVLPIFIETALVMLLGYHYAESILR